MNRRILKLAIPNIISNISVPLLSAVDTAVVGHLNHVYFLGAIAVGSMIFNFLYWGFGFLRMGTTGLTAQAFGEDDQEQSIHILSRSLLVALAGSILLLLLQGLIADASFYIVHSTPDVENYARSYFFIRIYAAPATLALYAFNGWFLGMQNARYPMIVTVAINGLNVILDILFVFHFGLKSDGVAWGTLVSAYVGLILCIIFFTYRYRSFVHFLKWFKVFELEAIKKFFTVNRDIFIRTLCLIFTYSFFTVKSAGYGEDILAANTILLQLWNIMSYGVDGFAYAAESLVGRFKGAKDTGNFQAAIRYTIIWGVGLGVVFSIGYAVFGRELVSLFTKDASLINLAMGFFVWTAIAPLINSFSFMLDGIFIGATATAAMRNSMIIATVIIFLPVYYITYPSFGYQAIWLAMITYMVARALALAFYMKRRIYAWF